jgi:hypothetical protein
MNSCLHSAERKITIAIEVEELGDVGIRGVTSLHAPSPVPDLAIPNPEEVQNQLRLILASPAFHGSKRCQHFLEYVCEKSLAGEAGALKERTLAIDVFGRPPRSELGEDTIVRVGAREVRKRLAQFYVSPEGMASKVRVELPAGSYAPEFHYNNAPVEKVEHEAAPPAVVVAKRPNRRRTVMRVVGAAGVLILAAALALWTGVAHKATVLTRFWKPVFDSNEPLLIGVAHPLVYHPSIRALKLSERNLPPLEIPMQRALRVNPKELDGSDLIPVPDEYVAFGDMAAVNQITALLARRSKNVRLRFANTISFADLRQTPVLLVGAVTNHWTMELQQNWRFQFRFQPGYSAVLVDTADKAHPGAERQWSVPATNDDSTSDDYVLICRLKSASTGGFIVVVSGVKWFGTEAAGRVVTDADQLAAIVRDLPADWEKRNLQVVLHVRVIGNTAAQPEVAAWHVW